MNTNLTHSHTQWANRPDDECFPDIITLEDAVLNRRHISYEEECFSDDLRFRNDMTFLYGDKPISATNWSFGQICSVAQVPAQYMIELAEKSPRLASECLNLGIETHRDSHKLMLRTDLAMPEHSELASITSPSYGRI